MISSMEAYQYSLFFFVLVWSSSGLQVNGQTYPQDAAALRSLRDQWLNTPPSWDKSDDPCGMAWDGVSCTNSRVTTLQLSSMNLIGEIGGDLGELSKLRSIDLSFNRGLIGSLSPRIGELQNLNTLILVGCGFTGEIPSEIGNLAELAFLALNSNNFVGTIPPALGKLSNLYWLDLSDNKLTGSIPVSTVTTPGLDLLLRAKHLRLSTNQLSGSIPPKLFSSDMRLIVILLNGNQLSGPIPSTLGLVQALETLRLNVNNLSGAVPSNVQNLTNLNELMLANNRLTGSVPDLSGLKSLNYVDLSNNTFDPSEAPLWFTTMPSLTSLVMENGSLHGIVPQLLFKLPQLQQVRLKDNLFNATLDMGVNISQQLKLVDVQNNNISSLVLSSGYTETLILTGNPVCAALPNSTYCYPQQENTHFYPCKIHSSIHITNSDLRVHLDLFKL